MNNITHAALIIAAIDRREPFRAHASKSTCYSVYRHYMHNKNVAVAFTYTGRIFSTGQSDIPNKDNSVQYYPNPTSCLSHEQFMQLPKIDDPENSIKLHNANLNLAVCAILESTVATASSIVACEYLRIQIATLCNDGYHVSLSFRNDIGTLIAREDNYTEIEHFDLIDSASCYLPNSDGPYTFN